MITIFHFVYGDLKLALWNVSIAADGLVTQGAQIIAWVFIELFEAEWRIYASLI